MRLHWRFWLPWDQTRAISNARSASIELSRCRAEREEVDSFVARHLAGVPDGTPLAL